jgi:hypothetical protein
MAVQRRGCGGDGDFDALGVGENGGGEEQGSNYGAESSQRVVL